jgi:DNA-binding transcriptional ArsR family regulator
MIEEMLKTKADVKRVLQVALYHDKLDGIKAGLRMFPSNRLILLYHISPHEVSRRELEERVQNYVDQVEEVLGIGVEVIQLSSNLFETVFDTIKEIYKRYKSEYDDIILNLTEGDKILTCNALSSAFVFGLRAFWTDGVKPYVFPIIKLGYHRAVSDAKLDILRAIQRSRDGVQSLEDLVLATGYDKAQISHHINGGPQSRGLVELGLVETERLERGRLAVKLTALGKIFLTSLEEE